MCLSVINKVSKKIIRFKDNKGSVERNIEKNIYISNKPIFVYKKFDISYDSETNSKLISKITKLHLKTPFQFFPVNMDGELMSCEKFTGNFYPSKLNPFYVFYFYLGINQGIHAYTNRKHGLLNLRLNQILVECMIPEHTPVIYGGNSDIVSLQLIIPPITKKELPPSMQDKLDKNLIL